MTKTAYQIQQERTKELEDKADQLLQQCTTITLASVTEKGYPRICAIDKVKDNGFKELFFFTSKRSHINGKATHFENNAKASVCYHHGNDSVTLIGEIEIVSDNELLQQFDELCDRRFFRQGVNDPKCRLLCFRTIEATFWIEGKFRTCKYKSGNQSKR